MSGHTRLEIACDSLTGHKATVKIGGQVRTDIARIDLTVDAAGANKATLVTIPDGLSLDVRACITERDPLAEAFALWEKRYRETPDQFMSDWEKAATGLDDYGTGCAAYMRSLLEELGQ